MRVIKKKKQTKQASHFSGGGGGCGTVNNMIHSKEQGIEH